MQMITRRLGVTERTSTASTLDVLLRAWTWPHLEHAHLFLARGFPQGVGSYLTSIAYRSAEATLVAPFEYVAPPMAIGRGFPW